MGSNSFGKVFKFTTWGESHGKALGVVIDGCPAGLDIDEEEINAALALRAPGKNLFSSQRIEPDKAQILSGTFEGKTTGAPISIMIANQDADSSKYEPIKDLLRPGHANFTYLEKYGIFDYRGGGRASARETLCRVAAGAVAKKLLSSQNIQVLAYLKQVYTYAISIDPADLAILRTKTYESPVFCPDQKGSLAIQDLINQAKLSGDSYGGVVEFRVAPIPSGLGEPIYYKLDAALASAMMSLPAAKGFEIGSGFGSVGMKGSEHNDEFIEKSSRVMTATNHAGGVLGGISTGMPIIGRVAFKPTSSIMKSQQTLDLKGSKKEFKLPPGSRHDPCVAIRAVPVVEAMVALVVADVLLFNRSAKI